MVKIEKCVDFGRSSTQISEEIEKYDFGKVVLFLFSFSPLSHLPLIFLFLSFLTHSPPLYRQKLNKILSGNKEQTLDWIEIWKRKKLVFLKDASSSGTYR